MSKKPKYIKKTSKAAIGTSIFWLLMFFAFLMISIFEPESSNLAATIFVLFMIIFLFYISIKGIRNRWIFKLNDKYSAILQHKDNISLNRLATMMNINEKAVVKELNLLIGYNFLGDGFIDMNKKLLVLKKDATEQKSEKKYSLKCDSCGGTNIIEEGAVAKCEYCGRLLQHTDRN